MSGQSGTKVIIIKKKAKHAGHHGGAWKVAYADFVTAMMALFIVLWLLTQTDQKSREALAAYFRTGSLPGGTLMLGEPAGSNPPVSVNIFPAGTQGGASDDPEAEALNESVSNILNEAGNDPALAPLLEHVTLRQTPEGTVIELIDGTDNFLFSVASSNLKPGAVHFLSKLAPMLGKLRSKIEIHGHTDARPFEQGTKKGNWQLSFERANEARHLLEQNGVASGRIIGVQAHADSDLLNKDDPFSGQNRRLSILLLNNKRKGNKGPRPEPVSPRSSPVKAAKPTAPSGGGH